MRDERRSVIASTDLARLPTSATWELAGSARTTRPWSSPAARMREFVQAMRAIWHCWRTGEKLAFEGEFYRHNLMTPMFTPSRTEYGAPGVHVAGVGPLMTEVAAEVADGMIAHGFTTAKYLEEVTLPAVERGLKKAGKPREALDISSPIIAVTGLNEEAFEQSKLAVKSQLAFYASTPAYRPVLELHGWGDVQTEANRLTREGRWADMGELITDEILSTFAVVSEDIEALPGLLKQRYGHLVDTWQCTVETGDRERQAQFIAAVQGTKPS